MNPASTWLRFNLVGVLGFVVQAAVLWVLVALFRVPASIAIAAAVFATVSHNFVWHERFTWPGTPREGRLKRWAGFSATTGALSIVANVALTGAIARATGLPIVAANLVAVVLLSVATFLVSDRVIFRTPGMSDPAAPIRWPARPPPMPNARASARPAMPRTDPAGDP